MHPFVRFVSARGPEIRPVGGRAGELATAMLAKTADIRKTLAQTSVGPMQFLISISLRVFAFFSFVMPGVSIPPPRRGRSDGQRKTSRRAHARVMRDCAGHAEGRDPAAAQWAARLARPAKRHRFRRRPPAYFLCRGRRPHRKWTRRRQTNPGTFQPGREANAARRWSVTPAAPPLPPILSDRGISETRGYPTGTAALPHDVRTVLGTASLNGAELRRVLSPARSAGISSFFEHVAITKS